MEVDSGHVPPSSQHCGVHEDRNKTDENVQIKAGKSEVKHDIEIYRLIRMDHPHLKVHYIFL